MRPLRGGSLPRVVRLPQVVRLPLGVAVVESPASPLADVILRLQDPEPSRIWVESPQGAIARQLILTRLRTWIQHGVPPRQILVLLPQLDRREQYRSSLASELDDPSLAAGVGIQTYYGLASSAVRLLWPDVAAAAGFQRPLDPPVFLTYETAQYLMSQMIGPLLAEGYFEGLAMRPQRVLSQLLDNLNKAAVNGYAIEQVGQRLKAAWSGDRESLRFFDQAQECIERFRSHCLQHNLLDISLAIDLFHRFLRPGDACAAYLSHFSHLAVEGVEESVPVAQDFLARQLQESSEALLVYRRHGGFRVFLGVDPLGALRLRDDCPQQLSVETPLAPVDHLAEHIISDLDDLSHDTGNERPYAAVAATTVRSIAARHRGGMIDAVSAQVVELVASGEAEPGEIAIVAPYADGVLRFVLQQALREHEIPFAVVRRFESLREEPLVRGALALAALAHAEWTLRPHPWDVAEGLAEVLGIDAVRAAILGRAVYDRGQGQLRGLADLAQEDLDERVEADNMRAYDGLWQWLQRMREGATMPLDHFLRRLFGEILSRPDLDPTYGTLFARFIASAEAFRKTAPALSLQGRQVGERYAQMVAEGVVAAAYETPMSQAVSEAVLVVAPVTTYLLDERQVRFQFWLDVGSIHWWAPPHQPLTNPHVLARGWPLGQAWTDKIDFQRRNEVLGRLVRGLCTRVSDVVYLCWSELEAAGEPQDSPLLHAVTDLVIDRPADNDPPSADLDQPSVGVDRRPVDFDSPGADVEPDSGSGEPVDA